MRPDLTPAPRPPSQPRPAGYAAGSPSTLAPPAQLPRVLLSEILCSLASTDFSYFKAQIEFTFIKQNVCFMWRFYSCSPAEGRFQDWEGPSEVFGIIVDFYWERKEGWNWLSPTSFF